MIRRTINGIIVGALVIAALKFLPGWGLFTLLAAFSLAVQIEFFRMMKQGGHSSCLVLGCILGTLWLFGKFAFAVKEAPVWLGASSWETVLLGVFMFAMFLRLLFDPKARPVEQASVTCLGFFYVPFLLGFYLPLATYGATKPFEFTSDGVFLVFYLSLVVKMTDVGAFAVGCSCGRHKMFPRISPKKSWEGFAGGVATAILVSIGLVALARHADWVSGAAIRDWSLLRAAWVGLVLALLGVLGDLIESMLKRAVNVKDSSGIVPGMGGFLDMFDSILFAPMFIRLLMKWIEAF